MMKRFQFLRYHNVNDPEEKGWMLYLGPLVVYKFYARRPVLRLR